MSNDGGQRTLDPSALAELRDALGDDELVVAIVGSFLAETPGQVATLAAAEERGDLPTLVATAHLIKGSALTFGADRLVQLCATLEHAPADSHTLVASVVQEFDDVCRHLSGYVDSIA